MVEVAIITIISKTHKEPLKLISYNSFDETKWLHSSDVWEASQRRRHENSNDIYYNHLQMVNSRNENSNDIDRFKIQ